MAQNGISPRSFFDSLIPALYSLGVKESEIHFPFCPSLVQADTQYSTPPIKAAPVIFGWVSLTFFWFLNKEPVFGLAWYVIFKLLQVSDRFSLRSELFQRGLIIGREQRPTGDLGIGIEVRRLQPIESLGDFSFGHEDLDLFGHVFDLDLPIRLKMLHSAIRRAVGGCRGLGVLRTIPKAGIDVCGHSEGFQGH